MDRVASLVYQWGERMRASLRAKRIDASLVASDVSSGSGRARSARFESSGGGAARTASDARGSGGAV